jgi:NAD(P)H dehydrogenase (quinone)
MYAVIGITGQVGGHVARTLLKAGQSIRAIVRDSQKGSVWAAQGCDVAVADMADDSALAEAFRGTQGAFILLPPTFDPSPGFPEARAVNAAVRSAVESGRPERVVCLSTIGAQAVQENLLTQLTLLERALSDAPVPVTFLRPAWFMENSSWDVTSAKDRGVVPSFLQPLDRPVPMVSVADVGRVAAELLQETWTGKRIVELEGPERVCPNDIAAALADLLDRAVRAEIVPRDTWAAAFASQGMKNYTPRIRMLDGFNEGWIEFEGGASGSRKGAVQLMAALRDVVTGQSS